MTTTFHPFPRLPLELRLVIWEASISPRTINFRTCAFRCGGDDQEQRVEVSIPTPKPNISFWTFTSIPPPPPILHTCRESRNIGLHFQGGYQKAFSTWCLPYFDGSWNNRYLWVNFELDIIDIGDESPIIYVDEDRDKIKRVKCELDRKDCVLWNKSEAQLFGWSIIKIFEQLRELCMCIPCDGAPLELHPDWLPGGSREAFMEGWRTVDYTISSRNGDEDGDGERSEDGKTDGKMWVTLVLEKENPCAANNSSRQ